MGTAKDERQGKILKILWVNYGEKQNLSSLYDGKHGNNTIGFQNFKRM